MEWLLIYAVMSGAAAPTLHVEPIQTEAECRLRAVEVRVDGIARYGLPVATLCINARNKTRSREETADELSEDLIDILKQFGRAE